MPASVGPSGRVLPEDAVMFHRGMPTEYLQADLDILNRTHASGDPRDRAISDAEVLKAVHMGMDSLPEGPLGIEVRINHRRLLDWTLQHAGVSRELWPRVSSLLRAALVLSPLSTEARAATWPAIRAGLEGLGLAQESVRRCRQLLLQVPGEGESAVLRLQGMVSTSQQRAPPFLDELQLLLECMRAWGVPSAQLVLEPLLPLVQDHFSGVFFQVYCCSPASSTGWARVAVGGRYDSLLRQAWSLHPELSALPSPGGVGVSINIDKVTALLARKSGARRSQQLRTSQADVLVCSRGGGRALLLERLRLSSALWAEGIRCELLPLTNPSMEDQHNHARGKGIKWLVTLEADTLSSANTARVKGLERKVERDISLDEARSRARRMHVPPTSAGLLLFFLFPPGVPLCVPPSFGWGRPSSRCNNPGAAQVARFLRDQLQGGHPGLLASRGSLGPAGFGAAGHPSRSQALPISGTGQGIAVRPRGLDGELLPLLDGLQ